jgi:hypothetical protein
LITITSARRTARPRHRRSTQALVFQYYGTNPSRLNRTQMLGVTVIVERIDMNDADEIVAVCQRGHEWLRLPVLDLPLLGTRCVERLQSERIRVLRTAYPCDIV